MTSRTDTLATRAIKSVFRGEDGVGVYFFDAEDNPLYNETEDDMEAADGLIWRKVDRQGAPIIVHIAGVEGQFNRRSVVEPGDPYP